MEFECLTAGMSTIETPPLAAPVPELSILSQTAESSVIRDLLRLVAQSDVLSLAGGLPAPSCLPTERIAEAASRVLAADLSGGLEHPLQYSPTAGMARLFDALGHRGWLRTPDALITTGSQQALDLLGAALLDAGDAIVMAVPSYLGAIQAFGAYRPRIVGVAADDQGLDTEDLARLLADGLRPKFVYVVSQFANPDGATLSDMRRRELARLADHYGFFILDDDPYGQLRFAGVGLVPLAELSDRVITMGSASKVLAPGLRVGWTEGPGSNRRGICIRVRCRRPSRRTSLVTMRLCSAIWRGSGRRIGSRPMCCLGPSRTRPQRSTWMSAGASPKVACSCGSPFPAWTPRSCWRPLSNVVWRLCPEPPLPHEATSTKVPSANR